MKGASCVFRRLQEQGRCAIRLAHRLTRGSRRSFLRPDHRKVPGDRGRGGLAFQGRTLEGRLPRRRSRTQRYHQRTTRRGRRSCRERRRCPRRGRLGQYTGTSGTSGWAHSREARGLNRPVKTGDQHRGGRAIRRRALKGRLPRHRSHPPRHPPRRPRRDGQPSRVGTRDPCRSRGGQNRGNRAQRGRAHQLPPRSRTHLGRRINHHGAEGGQRESRRRVACRSRWGHRVLEVVPVEVRGCRRRSCP